MNHEDYSVQMTSGNAIPVYSIQVYSGADYGAL